MELRKKRCRQRIRSLRLLTQGVFVFCQRDRLLRRIMPGFLSMGFHRRWQVGGREIYTPRIQLLRPASEKPVHLGRAPSTLAQCAVSSRLEAGQPVRPAHTTRTVFSACSWLALSAALSCQEPGVQRGHSPR